MSATYPVIIFGHFDTGLIQDPESSFVNLYQENTLTPNQKFLTFLVQERGLSSNDKLVITSNGIDGVGVENNTFNIDTNKFTNSNIHFVVRIKTQDNIPIKSVSTIPITALNLSIVTANSTISARFFSNFGELSSQTYGGFFKGFFNTSVSATNARIRAIYNGVYSLTGFSSPFNIYPSEGIYNIRKINEDNDQAESYKLLAFQQILQDKLNFFNTFLGQIVGDKNSDPNTLGIKIFEKIANYVSNNNDVIYSNLPQLISMLRSIGDTYIQYNVQFPPSLQRLVDVLSIPLSYQKGGRNQYSSNFDTKGYVTNNVYGKNKGDKLNFFTSILYRNESPTYYKQIVAYEKFSKIYTVLSPLIPDAQNVTYIDPVTKSYPLSTYSSDWGWGLILPNNINNVDIPKYYDFYEYNNVVDGALIQKFIDFDNHNNTYLDQPVTYFDYAKTGGIIDNIITHHLLTNTGIIST